MNNPTDAVPKFLETELKEENRRIRLLGRLVDFSIALIAQSSLPREEALRIAKGVKNRAPQLFPGKEETFDIIYTPRFRRIISEKYGLH